MSNELESSEYKTFVNAVLQRIKKEWVSPPGQLGRHVHVVFRVNSDGYVSNLRLDQSSGVVKFDRAALISIGHIVAVSAPPAKLPVQMLVDFGPSNIELLSMEKVSISPPVDMKKFLEVQKKAPSGELSPDAAVPKIELPKNLIYPNHSTKKNNVLPIPK